ncbi:MAG: protein kinase [Gemmatimonadales bacterium]
MTDLPARLVSALSPGYRLERELGAGGMATVYLAQDLKHDRRVAIKVLKPDLAAVLGAERFITEIKTTAALQHPHILPLFDSGAADGFLYYVMPFVQGETLRSKLDRETQLGIDEAVRIAREVADALDYAHRHGVIHRDIKPENILLHDGRATVADFGIALAVSAAAGGRMTETGLSLGTPHYMSPEQATAEREITGRSDIYSLGCVLYEMLTGNPPHTGATAQQIIMKIVTEEAAPVSKLRKAVPEHVAAAVAQALEKLPADRFGTAREFAESLTNPTFTRRRMASAAGPSATTGVPGPLFAIVAIVAVAAVTWALLKPADGIGPSEYDVGLPDGAEMRGDRYSPFSVSPAGDFVVYEVVNEEGGGLWYRSLLDATSRRIAGSENARHPRISLDGTQVAFLRGGDASWTVEVMPVGGGRGTVLAQGRASASLDWLPDGRLLLVEGDGILARWLDPGGGSAVSRRITYCILPSGLPDSELLLCGGGGVKTAYRVDPADSTTFLPLWTLGPDSARVVGSHFRLIEGRYLTYLSVGGDLFAAPVDLVSGRVGRPVRMLSGLDRQAYTGAGTYDIAASGTLVYAMGSDKAIGHLVSATDQSLDTLPFGQEAFLRFSLSPDGRRLAAVVEVLDGQQLRIYDLPTGRHQVVSRELEISQPVWSPGGDEILIQTRGSLFLSSPDAVGLPQALPWSNGTFEGFRWLADGRLVGVEWGTGIAMALHVKERPLTVDTLVSNASFVTVSPDGRWVAYNSSTISELWVEALPRTGRRTQVAPGSMEGAQWLSPSEFVYPEYGSPTAFHRVLVRAGGDPPGATAAHWFDAPRLVSTPGQSFALTPEGRVVYVQGAPQRPAPYLRVIPNWVERMKRAVAEANK